MFNVDKIIKISNNKLQVPVGMGTSCDGKYINFIFHTKNINESFVKLPTDWLSQTCLLIKCINNSQWHNSCKQKCCIFIKCLASGSECEQTHWDSAVKAICHSVPISWSKALGYISELVLPTQIKFFRNLHKIFFILKINTCFLNTARVETRRRAERNWGSQYLEKSAYINPFFVKRNCTMPMALPFIAVQRRESLFGSILKLKILSETKLLSAPQGMYK